MKPRLLVVDDALARSLRRSGYEVDEADGGRSALAMVRKADYQLVVLDDVTPDVLEEVHNTEMPVLMITGPAYDVENTVARISDLLAQTLPDPAATLPPRLPPGVAATEANSDELAPGTEVGTFTIRRVLGRGGMGVVYEAESRQEGTVALKMLHARLSADPSAESRFRREARNSAGIEHPNVVRIFHAGTWERRFYIVMEHIQGGLSAQRIIREYGALPGPEATDILLQACRGLSAAHDKGIVHRDLKPDNILIAEDGTAKLTDFGLAKGMQLTGETALTTTGTLIGTPHYMSPEQVRQQPLDARSDIYSLGGTYFALLKGHHPYSHLKNWFQVLTAHCAEPVPELEDIPEPYVSILRKAMAKAPQDRYASAQEMLQALSAIGR